MLGEPLARPSKSHLSTVDLQAPAQLVFQIEVAVCPKRYGGGGVVGAVPDEESP